MWRNYSSFEIESAHEDEPVRQAGLSRKKKFVLTGSAVLVVLLVIVAMTTNTPRNHIDLARNIISRWRCSAGSYPSRTGARKAGHCLCVKCPPGSYCPGGFQPRKLCAPGYFQKHKGQNRCQHASRGHFVPRRGMRGQHACAVGHFQPHVAKHFCIRSFPGHFVPHRGWSRQVACGKGTFQPHRGQSRCIPAGRGHFVHRGGSKVQHKCPRGMFQPHGGRSNCQASSPGHYVSHAGSSRQYACHVGWFQGHRRQARCIPASIGHYVNRRGSNRQYPCPRGHFQRRRAQRGCHSAARGHFVPRPGMHLQITCPLGTYQPRAGQAGCIRASPGHYVNRPGFGHQVRCAPGWFQPHSGQRGCIAASVNHYVPHAGWNRQLRCAGGYHQPRRAQRGCIRRHRVVALVPFYRYWSGRDHFYTTNIHEIGTGHAGRMGRHGYRSEGIACWVSPRPVRGLVALFRYWQGHAQDHFYTTNVHEIGTGHVGRVGRHGYKSEGVAGYCSPRHVHGSVPLYRYYNAHIRDHFYTTNIHEIGTGHAGRMGRHGYRSEGIVCWVWRGRRAVLPGLVTQADVSKNQAEKGGDSEKETDADAGVVPQWGKDGGETQQGDVSEPWPKEGKDGEHEDAPVVPNEEVSESKQKVGETIVKTGEKGEE